MIDSDTLMLKPTEEFAKRELEERMVGAPEGDIRVYGTPSIEPYDQIRSAPICRGAVDPTSIAPASEYEVQRVVHKKEAGKEYQTRMEVSVYVDMDDIVVVESRLEDGSDEPADDHTMTPIPTGVPSSLRPEDDDS